MPGEQFSQLYIERGDRLADSIRARRRVGTLFRGNDFERQYERLAQYVEGELGARLDHGGDDPYYWDLFVQRCDIGDFLDLVTLVYHYFARNVGAQSALRWRDALRRIISEEHLAYAIDDQGGVHPAVDQAFQQNRKSAVAGLQSPRYQNVRASIERVSPELTSNPPNYKEAWRATFAAVEGLFRLMFPTAPRLTADGIAEHLGPLVQRTYRQDATALRAAVRLLNGFREWVESSHNFRHEPGAEDPVQPPADVAILAISNGTSYLRWLAGLDEDRAGV